MSYCHIVGCTVHHSETTTSCSSFKKSRTECRQYLTSSLRHELTRQVNDPCEALVLKDKVRFSEVFEDILGRRVMTFDEDKKANA